MKSYFIRILTSFLVILLSVNLLMLVIFFFRADRIVMEQKKTEMEEIADAVHRTVIRMSRVLYIPMAAGTVQQALTDELQNWIRGHRAVVWIVDEQGRVLGNSSPDIPSTDLFIARENGTNVLRDSEMLRRYFSDARNSFTDDTTFTNMVAEDGEQIRTTFVKKYAIEVFGAMGYEVQIATLVHYSGEYIRLARNRLFQSFALLKILSVILGAFLAFFVVRSFTRPLQEFHRVAVRVSRGDFASRMKYAEKDDEIGNLARTFNDMMDKVTDMETSRQRLMSDVAHELRTPLTTINGFVCGILDGTIPSEEQNRYLQVVRDEINRLGKLISNILILSKMDLQQEELDYSIFNVNKLIRDSLVTFQPAIEKKKLIVSTIFEEEDIFVKAGEDDIRRVWINLLDNAIKFSVEGGAILISARYRKNKIQLSIRDEGIGIPLEEQDRIWERFYKGDRSRGIDSSSTGLGLSIVKSILQRHHETIEVYSAPGRGSLFTFTLQRGEF